MPESPWAAEIALGGPVRSRGLRLVSSVTPEGPWRGATVVPGVLGGAPSELEATLGARIATVGKGRVVMFPRSADLKGWHGDPRWERDHRDHPATHATFWTLIRGTPANAFALGTGLADHPVIDGEKDEVYGAIVEHGGMRGILYFSQAERDVVKHPRIPGSPQAQVVVPAGRIIFAPFAPPA